MNKYRFLKFIKYKEPPKINININTIKEISSFKLKNRKNIDINDINYSKNLWKNIEKYEKINFK